MTSSSRSIPLVTALQLGLLLRAARKQRRLTQAQVASQLNLSQNRVSHLESHPEELSFRQLLAWSAVVGLQLQVTERLPADAVSDLEW